jgi:hypothetical protein
MSQSGDPFKWSIFGHARGNEIAPAQLSRKKGRLGNGTTLLLDQKWRRFVQEFVPAQGTDDEWRIWLWNELQIKRPFHMIYHEDMGLGIQFRWNIAINVLKNHLTKEKLEDFKNSIKRELFWLGTLDGIESRELEALSNKANSRENIAELCKLISEKLAVRWEKANGKHEFAVEDFLAPAHGMHAVLNFEKFLETGLRPVDSMGWLVPERKFDRSPERLNVLMQLYTSIGKSHLGRPIECLYIPGSPLEMCAVAHEILRHLQSHNDQRPVLLLPCSKQIPEHNFRGIDFLVYNISNFLTHKPLTHQPPRLTPTEIENHIQIIRSAISVRPAVIVFVGYSATYGPYSELLRTIKDKTVVELLAQLVHPHIGEAENPVDVKNFEETRFIVLSDSPLDVLQEYVASELKIPEPKNTQPQVEILRVIAPEFADSIMDQLARARSPISESAIMAYVQLKTIHAVSRAAELPPLHALGRYESSIFSHLVQSIRELCLPLELLLLRIIALVGTGVRPETLWRCAKIWTQAVSKLDERDVPPHLSISYSDDSPIQQIKSFKNKFAFILVDGIDEPFPELEVTLHPFEYPDTPEPTTGYLGDTSSTNPARSIDFRHKEIRDAIFEDIDKEIVQWIRPFLHEIICIEALRQQSLMQRHGNADSRISIRSYLRALQGFYHGMLSLPCLEQLPNIQSWPTSSIGTLLPTSPQDRFRFLYSVIFQHLLEGNNSHRLSLKWTADNVKKDLLQLAHSAFRSDIRTNPLNFSEVPLWHDHSLLATTLTPHYEDHLDAIAVVLARTDDLSNWDLLAKLLKSNGPSKINSVERSFTIIERACLDIASVRFGPQAHETEAYCMDRIREIGFDPVEIEGGPWYHQEDDSPLVPSQDHFDNFLDHIQRKAESVNDRRALASGLSRLADLRYQTIDFDNAKFKWRSSMEAFSMLILATRLLGTLQERQSRMPGLSPQGMRILARSGIEALRQLLTPPRGRKLFSVSPVDMENMRKRLTHEVRKALDLYSYSTVVAPDIVSMLILESRFARTIGAMSEVFTDNRHFVALAFLTRAEKTMANFNPRPRLRIRFLLERCATLRGLSKMRLAKFGSSDEYALRYIKLAQLDVVQLTNIVQIVFGASSKKIGEVWRHAVENQANETNAVASKLELRSH